jgi:hypothetical protein
VKIQPTSSDRCWCPLMMAEKKRKRLISMRLDTIGILFDVQTAFVGRQGEEGQPHASSSASSRKIACIHAAVFLTNQEHQPLWHASACKGHLDWLKRRGEATAMPGGHAVRFNMAVQDFVHEEVNCLVLVGESSARKEPADVERETRGAAICQRKPICKCELSGRARERQGDCRSGGCGFESRRLA